MLKQKYKIIKESKVILKIPSDRSKDFNCIYVPPNIANASNASNVRANIANS